MSVAPMARRPVARPEAIAPSVNGDPVDCGWNGRRAIVTGGSSGIGRAVAVSLARRGWRVVATGRDEDRLAGTRAIARSRSDGADRCRTLSLDQSDPAAVRTAAAAMRDRDGPLDLLVLNAGIMAPPLRRSGADGHELQLTVNHLSHYVLAAKLLPSLRLAPDARIVWVSSIRHHAAPGSEREPWDPDRHDGRATRRRSAGTSPSRCGWTTAWSWTRRACGRWRRIRGGPTRAQTRVFVFVCLHNHRKALGSS